MGPSGGVGFLRDPVRKLPIVHYDDLELGVSKLRDVGGHDDRTHDFDDGDPWYAAHKVWASQGSFICLRASSRKKSRQGDFRYVRAYSDPPDVILGSRQIDVLNEKDEGSLFPQVAEYCGRFPGFAEVPLVVVRQVPVPGDVDKDVCVVEGEILPPGLSFLHTPQMSGSDIVLQGLNGVLRHGLYVPLVHGPSSCIGGDLVIDSLEVLPSLSDPGQDFAVLMSTLPSRSTFSILGWFLRRERQMYPQASGVRPNASPSALARFLSLLLASIDSLLTCVVSFVILSLIYFSLASDAGFFSDCRCAYARTPARDARPGTVRLFHQLSEIRQT